MPLKPDERALHHRLGADARTAPDWSGASGGTPALLQVTVRSPKIGMGALMAACTLLAVASQSVFAALAASLSYDVDSPNTSHKKA